MNKGIQDSAKAKESKKKKGKKELEKAANLGLSPEKNHLKIMKYFVH